MSKGLIRETRDRLKHTLNCKESKVAPGVTALITTRHIIIVESWGNYMRTVNHFNRYLPLDKCGGLKRHIHFCGTEPQSKPQFGDITYTVDSNINMLQNNNIVDECVIS